MKRRRNTAGKRSNDGFEFFACPVRNAAARQCQVVEYDRVDNHLVEEIGVWSTLFLAGGKIQRQRRFVLNAAKAESFEVGKVFVIGKSVRTDLDKCDDQKSRRQHP